MADKEYYSIEELKALQAERARKREQGLLDAEKTAVDASIERALTNPIFRVIKSSRPGFVILGARAPRDTTD